jgi:hypothetical protein
MRSEKDGEFWPQGKGKCGSWSQNSESEIKNAEVRPEELEVVKRKQGVSCSDER